MGLQSSFGKAGTNSICEKESFRPVVTDKQSAKVFAAAFWRCVPTNHELLLLGKFYFNPGAAAPAGLVKRICPAMCPFLNLPERTRGRWGLGITPAVIRTCSWVEPVLVAQIKFTEWTSDNQLRQPVYLGLRTDKAAKEVVRE
jgi:ATP dependent DNA ligase C terminal region